MAVISVVSKQEKLFRLSDSERAEKVQQLLGALGEIDYLKSERKTFLAGNNDRMKDVEARIAALREDLGLPESHLSPEMIRAREEERAR